jgi:hypothetical protein
MEKLDYKWWIAALPEYIDNALRTVQIAYFAKIPQIKQNIRQLRKNYTN